MRSVARANTAIAYNARDNGTRFWRGIAKLLACICILQVGVLLASTMDRDRDRMLMQQARDTVNSAWLYALLEKFQKQRMDQDKINGAFSDWMVEASKPGGPKSKWNPKNVKPLSTR